MATTYLDSGDTGFKISNNNTTVFGQTGDEQIIVEAGVTGIVTDQNVERVDLAGAAADFTYAQAGNQMQVYSGGNLVATIPLQGDTDGTQVVFSDGSVSAVLTAGVMTLGGATVSATAGAVVPTTIDTSIKTDATVEPPAPAASLSIADVTVAEDGGNATFTVTLSTAPGTGESVTVDYATADGTAKAGTDYTAASGTLTFAAGETTKTITVPIIDDTVVGTTDAFTVNLTNVTGTIGSDAATISDASATGTITENDVAVPGETFELTSGSDNITGTAGDDTITANIVQLPQTGALAESFTSIDTVDGGAGADTMNIQTDSTSQVSASIKNVETITYKAFKAQTFNMQNVTGVTTLENAGSTDKLTVSAVGAMADLKLTGLIGKDTDITYLSTATTSLTDVQTITLDGTRSLDKTTHSDLSLNDATIEGIKIISNGSTANRLNLDDVSRTQTLEVTGDAHASIAFLATNTAVTELKSVDASTAKGGVTIDVATNVTARSTDFNLVTGEGNDFISTAAVSKNQTFDLGAGDDTISIALGGTSVSSPVSITNTESLSLSATASAGFNAEKMVGVQNLNLSKAANAADVISVTKLDSTAKTINYTVVNDKATDNYALNGVLFGLNDNSGDSDSLTINVTHRNSDGIEVVRDEGIQADIVSINAAGIENLTIDTGSFLGTDKASTKTVVEGGLEIKALSAADMTTLTLKGNSLIAFEAGAATETLGANVKTIDASATTGGVILNVQDVADAGATGTANVKITLGSGNDTLNDLTSVAKTTVKTTGGDNTVTLDGDANDIAETLTISAGNGKDTINMSTIHATNAGAIKITLSDDDAVDTLDINASIAATKVTAGSNVAGGITVAGFEAGSGGDKLTFSSSSAAGTSPLVYSTLDIGDGTAAKTAASGMVVLSAGTSGGPASLSSADVQAWFLDLNGATAGGGALTFTGANDAFYAAVEVGGDTAIFAVDDVSANGGVFEAADSVALIVTLTGVSVADLTTDNFASFI